MGNIMANPATKTSPAAQSLRKEQAEQRRAERRKGGEDADLDEALRETFPASDPIAVQTPVKPGAKKRRA